MNGATILASGTRATGRGGALALLGYSSDLSKGALESCTCGF